MSFNTLFTVIKSPETHQGGGVKLYFTAAGGKVIAYLTTISSTTGLPDDVLAQAHIEQDSIRTNGQATVATWQSPVMLTEGVEYALCLQCADAVTAVQTAQVGKPNLNSAGELVTASPALGQLARLTEAGAAAVLTGTMLRFELLAVQYTQQEQTIALGTVDVEGATMLAVNAGADQPEATARVTYAMELIDPDDDEVKQTYKVETLQPVGLSVPFTGKVRVSAVLRVGASGLGAVLEPGAMLMVGVLEPEGIYITPAISTNGGSSLQVIYEADIPSGAACLAHMQVDGQSAWQLVPIDPVASGANSVGVIEIHHKLEGINATAVRVRLTPTGSPTARPYVRNMRAVVLP